jgi:hypothetical protein
VKVLLAVRVVGSRVAKKEEVLSPTTTSPVFWILNLVVPEEEAVKISPALVLLTIREALEPIPPLMERGAGVEALPTKTLVSASLVKRRLPEPLGERDKLSSETVEIVAAEPAPKEREVAEIPREAAEVMVVKPVAERVVSEESKVKILLPLLRVKPLVEVAIVAAEPPPKERVVASILRFAAESMVVKEAALRVVVPVKERDCELTVKRLPFPPPSGERTMLPVEELPMVKV